MTRNATPLLVALITTVLAATSAFAQAQEHAMPQDPHAHHAAAAEPASEVAPAAVDWTPAEVRRVDAAQQKLTLKHGDIRHLDMPGMTMAFRLKPGLLSAEQLAALKVGDRIEARIEQQQGQLVIVELRQAAASN
ncbi:MAG: copper-binding protein [Mitsuaria chitosanitabida]|uniref:copper-binding protein n=1 Tax=Roseateles chitosanitabidus TaxID=65048 RepID=UPI001B2A0F89|nr:copper-binding protein [Roseateles chitosanitabidus]MBO9686917.1 copper-binding protein [Roseateles chitosanitabidus]